MPFWPKVCATLDLPFQNPERCSSHLRRKGLVLEFSVEPARLGVPCFVVVIPMSFLWTVPSFYVLDKNPIVFPGFLPTTFNWSPCSAVGAAEA